MSMLAEIRCPLVLAVPNQNHRSTDAQNQLIHCSLVGSHKFKPKSQYDINGRLWGCSYLAELLHRSASLSHLTMLKHLSHKNS